MDSSSEAGRNKQDSLAKGKEYADQLVALLNCKPFGDEILAFAQVLAQKVVKSFDDSLSAEPSPSGSADPSPSGSADPKPQDYYYSHEIPLKPAKERSCGNKRRKGGESWVTVSAAPEDGYVWRKYGQKQTLNSKHPRCYYRCTYSFEQGCKATKQVQKIDVKGCDMFQTTYFDHHTCKHMTNASEIIPDFADDDLMESNLISFGRRNQADPTPVVIISPVNRESSKEETQRDLTDTRSSSIDLNVCKDLEASSSSESLLENSFDQGSYHR